MSGAMRASQVVEPKKLFLSTDIHQNQPDCNNMVEIYGSNATRTQIPHCSRTAPVVMLGQRSVAKDGKKPTLVLKANSGLQGPVVRLHNPQNENINMNQVMKTSLQKRLFIKNETCVAEQVIVGFLSMRWCLCWRSDIFGNRHSNRAREH